VETGVGKGDTVSVFYDPMIAKLVVWGRDRSSALTKLVDSLTKFQIAGLPTNIGFLKTLASHHAFAAGDVDTHFIDRFKEDLLPSTQAQEPNVPKATQIGAALTAAAFGIKCKQERADGLWSSGSGFRLNHAYTRMLHLDWKSETSDSFREPLSLKVTYGKDGNFLVEGEKLEKMTVTGKELPERSSDFRLNLDGKSVPVSLAQFQQGGVSHVHLWEGAQHHHFTIPVPAFDSDESQEHQGQQHERHAATQGPGAVVAPMAGRVVKIFAANGAIVKKGDSILVLEAMKMEHVVKAPIDGIIKSAEVEVGQQVSDSTVLCQIEMQDV
jgi:3-methylcrotonyl-CoA carboxylase alpha subunit